MNDGLGAPRLSVIGAGPIVPMHLDALLEAGFRLGSIASRPGSQRPSEIASRYPFESVIDGWQGVLAEDFDALLIATHTSATPEILSAAMQTGRPILVEKPVAYDVESVETLVEESAADRVLVGYNRRHYSSVAALKDAVAAIDGPVTFQAKIPEASWDHTLDAQKRSEILHANTVHVLDLLNYVFGPLDVKSVAGLAGDRGMASRVAVVEGPDKTLGSICVTFGSPANYRVEAFAEGRSFMLEPIEMFHESVGVKVIEPTQEVPLRHYTTVPGEGFALAQADQRFKPGFLGQAHELAQVVHHGTPLAELRSAGLTDAARALSFAQRLSAAE